VCTDHMQETSEKRARVVNLKSSNDNRNRNTVCKIALCSKTHILDVLK
jgi:hypothetical protein